MCYQRERLRTEERLRDRWADFMAQDTDDPYRHLGEEFEEQQAYVAGLLGDRA